MNYGINHCRFLGELRFRINAYQSYRPLQIIKTTDEACPIFDE
jgi:hypothetical protein